MAHPKRRQSKSRKNKRRSHFKVKIPLLMTCNISNKKNLYHHTYWIDNKLYYKGQVIFIKH